MRPCVRNMITTGSTKFLRAMNLPLRIGLAAFFSTRNRTIRPTTATPMDASVATLAQPFCWPKVGTQTSAPNMSRTNTAPAQSKPFIEPLGMFGLSLTFAKQIRNEIAHRATQIHMTIRHALAVPMTFMTMPPRVGPKMTMPQASAM